jgi:chromosome partitioning protein
MYDGRTNLAQQVVAEVKKHFAAKLYKMAIPRTVRLAEAPSFGKPITKYDGGSYAASAYRQLTEEILERESPKPAEAPIPPPNIPASTSAVP